MPSQAIKNLLNMYVSMSKGTVPEVVQQHIEDIYLTNSEADKEVRNFSNT